MIVHFPKFHEVSVFIIHTKTFLLTPESDYVIYVRPQVKPKKKQNKTNPKIFKALGTRQPPIMAKVIIFLNFVGDLSLRENIDCHKSLLLHFQRSQLHDKSQHVWSEDRDNKQLSPGAARRSMNEYQKFWRESQLWSENTNVEPSKTFLVDFLKGLSFLFL